MIFPNLPNHSIAQSINHSIVLRMHYDPIKRSLGNVFNRTPWLRRLFYFLLDLLLLRTWHVHRELRAWSKGRTQEPLNVLDLTTRQRASDTAAAGAARSSEHLNAQAEASRALARLADLASPLVPKLFEADRRR